MNEIDTKELDWEIWTWNGEEFAIVFATNKYLDVMIEYVTLSHYLRNTHGWIWTATHYIMYHKDHDTFIVTPKPDIGDELGFKEVIRIRAY